MAGSRAPWAILVQPGRRTLPAPSTHSRSHRPDRHRQCGGPDLARRARHAGTHPGRPPWRGVARGHLAARPGRRRPRHRLEPDLPRPSRRGRGAGRRPHNDDPLLPDSRADRAGRRRRCSRSVSSGPRSTVPLRGHVLRSGRPRRWSRAVWSPLSWSRPATSMVPRWRSGRWPVQWQHVSA